MRRSLFAAVQVSALVAVTLPLSAQIARQVVTFRVIAINQMAVSGNPAALVVNRAVAGSLPTSATASGTSYGITTNEGNKKIVVSLDADMPAGVSLAVALGAPAGAQSLGAVALGTSGTDAVTGIPIVSASALPISYTLNATPQAGVAPVEARTVSMTIIAGS